MNYDPDGDVLYIVAQKGEEEEFVEIAPGVNGELDAEGKVVGVEILNASRFLSSLINPLHQKQIQLQS
ncbi:hypothetical protein HKBW3S03_01385 [Candidatus Hakubella thermalkaliphila]|uniref:DUF2283 domain-containing protein n=1 Tax=Candidatus Hakubella thermalkaliphila TaxID=2754717 RepID=A0A6V8PEP4_9ACTN|nr:DUF2283 domain-containing protein [Candidatus Hakubella thermalkaliphila]GFP19881.1 hypothetical protein HKBW3S03_01385 [Candidatus Hakubella thermalkaliphila]GFP30813.1 hypothetical protein HKBW3S34_01733 [Candidatus Hakubella thermalkaliphila]GFP39580.1 hypothetical protein HKBW3S47_01278 [Candidatus Hakubella thermalkaliphila]GFP42294.1 hypothetical protein HKBW3C_01420 [Candidatus Hakubella thermalkaliphila]